MSTSDSKPITILVPGTSENADVVGMGAALAVQHAVMVPAMLGVMLWRYDEYARPHAASLHVSS